MKNRYREPTEEEINDSENPDYYLILTSQGPLVLQEKNDQGEWEDVKIASWEEI